MAQSPAAAAAAASSSSTTSNNTFTPLTGSCPCTTIRYHLTATPLTVHLCHCRSCQRESGTAFKLNIMIESSHVILLSDAVPEIIAIPSDSGAGQQIHRCPKCKHAVWTNYGPGGEGGDVLRFVQAGTLDDPGKCPPQVQIYVRSKLPWVGLVEGVPSFEEFYDRNQVWGRESLERLEGLMRGLKG